MDKIVLSYEGGNESTPEITSTCDLPQHYGSSWQLRRVLLLAKGDESLQEMTHINHVTEASNRITRTVPVFGNFRWFSISIQEIRPARNSIPINFSVYSESEIKAFMQIPQKPSWKEQVANRLSFQHSKMPANSRSTTGKTWKELKLPNQCGMVSRLWSGGCMHQKNSSPCSLFWRKV